MRGGTTTAVVTSSKVTATNGSVEVHQECAVVLVGDATELVSRETAGRVEGVGVPPVRELLQKLRDNEVPVYV